MLSCPTQGQAQTLQTPGSSLEQKRRHSQIWTAVRGSYCKPHVKMFTCMCFAAVTYSMLRRLTMKERTFENEMHIKGWNVSFNILLVLTVATHGWHHGWLLHPLYHKTKQCVMAFSSSLWKDFDDATLSTSTGSSCYSYPYLTFKLRSVRMGVAPSIAKPYWPNPC